MCRISFRRQTFIILAICCAPANQALAGCFQKLDGRVLRLLEAHQGVAFREALDDPRELVALFTREYVLRQVTSSTTTA
jgi:hypothetical protein